MTSFLGWSEWTKKRKGKQRISNDFISFEIEWKTDTNFLKERQKRPMKKPAQNHKKGYADSISSIVGDKLATAVTIARLIDCRSRREKRTNHKRSSCECSEGVKSKGFSVIFNVFASTFQKPKRKSFYASSCRVQHFTFLLWTPPNSERKQHRWINNCTEKEKKKWKNFHHLILNTIFMLCIFFVRSFVHRQRFTTRRLLKSRPHLSTEFASTLEKQTRQHARQPTKPTEKWSGFFIRKRQKCRILCTNKRKTCWDFCFRP